MVKNKATFDLRTSTQKGSIELSLQAKEQGSFMALEELIRVSHMWIEDFSKEKIYFESLLRGWWQTYNGLGVAMTKGKEGPFGLLVRKFMTLVGDTSNNTSTLMTTLDSYVAYLTDWKVEYNKENGAVSLVYRQSDGPSIHFVLEPNADGGRICLLIEGIASANFDGLLYSLQNIKQGGDFTTMQHS